MDTNSGASASAQTISTWLITPELFSTAAGTLTFWTRRQTGFRPDRLIVRLSDSGSSLDIGTDETEVGDFDTVLLDINPTYTNAGINTLAF
jgi:hypothetical protein